jgi:hypothetical protein
MHTVYQGLDEKVDVPGGDTGKIPGFPAEKTQKQGPLGFVQVFR